MRENVRKRMIGATAGIVLGLSAALYLHQTKEFDVALTTFIIGAPLAVIFARIYGGPLSEAMGKEELDLTRRVKTVALFLGLIASIVLGAMMDNIISGIGLGVMLLVTAGPRLGLLIDERMSKVYGKAATNAFAVFSLCLGYLGFYHIEKYPAQVNPDTFVAGIWISWASLAISLFYYYFVSGE